MSIFNFISNHRKAKRLDRLKATVKAYDAKIDDPHGDGTGNDARVPTADDYNAIYQMIFWGWVE